MGSSKLFNVTETNNKIKSRGQVENKKKNKVRKESFVLIPGWAVCDLGLKGNELLIYSIIYGFSQEENQTFRGSLRYLMDWTNSTKKSVLNILKSLVGKGLIKKIERFENNVKFCEYYATRLRGGGDDGGGKVPKSEKEDDQNSDYQPGKETLNDQNDQNKKSDQNVVFETGAIPVKSTNADVLKNDQNDQKVVQITPVVKKVHRGGVKSTPNNIEDNIDIYRINSFRINTPSSVKKPIEGGQVKNKKNDQIDQSEKKNQKKILKTKTLKKEFQSIWDTYPNKKGKARAFNAYLKARKNGTTAEEVKTGVENYNKEIRAKSIDQQYIKHGNTWFRNRCWEDEYNISPNTGSKPSYASYNINDYEKTMDTIDEYDGFYGTVIT